MKEFWVDFSGYVVVAAENAKEAENKMWDAINRTLAFPTAFSDDVWEVENIEEKSTDNPLLEPVYGNFFTTTTPTAQEWEDFWNER